MGNILDAPEFLDKPAIGAAAVTPNDSTVFTQHSRALWVGGDGNIAVVMANGDAVTLSGVIGGTLLPIRVKQVKSTGTTATNIVSLY